MVWTMRKISRAPDNWQKLNFYQINSSTLMNYLIEAGKSEAMTSRRMNDVHCWCRS